MKFIDALNSALAALRANPMRSCLTMLGVIIGVAAVILVISIGAGARAVIVEQIRSLGSNVIVINGRSSLWLASDDATAIISEVPGVRLAAPLVRDGVPAERDNILWWTSLFGVTENFLDARDWPVALGRNITEDEVATGAKVVLLGSSVANLLFADRDPLGAKVRLKGISFNVVGVLASKGQTHTGRDQDDVVVVPLKTASARLIGINPLNPKRVDTILVKVDEGWDMNIIEKDIRDILSRRPRLASTLDEDINIKNLAQVIQIKENSANAMSILVAIIASISLIVGGIGIMNIMLVSVLERTREIGIRMAVGAKRKDIMTQFLVEATTLSGIGGVLGICLGVAGAAIAAMVADWPFVVHIEAVVLGAGFSIIVGSVFGFYPARQAARLDPIEALRYE
ncbi:MAG: ABC transporter permease [Hyphomicrobiales bacterium]|nr:ABC transporter permease [Hyphomicrobiales bacterium]